MHACLSCYFVFHTFRNERKVWNWTEAIEFMTWQTSFLKEWMQYRVFQTRWHHTDSVRDTLTILVMLGNRSSRHSLRTIAGMGSGSHDLCAAFTFSFADFKIWYRVFSLEVFFRRRACRLWSVQSDLPLRSFPVSDHFSKIPKFFWSNRPPFVSDLDRDRWRFELFNLL